MSNLAYKPGQSRPSRTASRGSQPTDYVSPRTKIDVMNAMKGELGKLIKDKSQALPVGESEDQNGKTTCFVKDRVANLSSHVSFCPSGHKSESELKFTLFDISEADLDLSKEPRYADVEVDRKVLRIPALIKKGEKKYYYVLLKKGKGGDEEMKTENIISLFTNDSAKKKAFGQKNFSVSLQTVVYTN